MLNEADGWAARVPGFQGAWATGPTQEQAREELKSVLVTADYSRVRELCTQYNDFPLGFVDAAVVAITERLGELKLATLDHRHFRVVRPRHTASLTLLPA